MQNNPQLTTAQLGSSMLATSKQIVQYAAANLKGELKFEPDDDYEKVHMSHITADNVIIGVNLFYGGAETQDECSYNLTISYDRILPKVEMTINFFHGTNLFHLMPEKIISALHQTADLNKKMIIAI